MLIQNVSTNVDSYFDEDITIDVKTLLIRYNPTRLKFITFCNTDVN